MRIYILDVSSKGREQMVDCMSENKAVTSLEVFEDYIQFIEQVGNSPPEYCVIRLGRNEIPGLKAAEMATQINPNIRIIFVSEERGYAVDAFEAGAYGYLTYPVDKVKLFEFLKTMQ